MKQLAILEQRKFDDEDVTGDVEFLTEKLQSSVQDLSSFDEYATEVRFAKRCVIIFLTNLLYLLCR